MAANVLKAGLGRLIDQVACSERPTTLPNCNVEGGVTFRPTISAMLLLLLLLLLKGVCLACILSRKSRRGRIPAGGTAIGPQRLLKECAISERR